MENSTTSWKNIFLAITPGVFCVFQESDILGEATFAIMVPIIIILSFLILFLRQGSWLSTWRIPAIGTLIWESFRLLRLLYGPHSLIFTELILKGFLIIIVLVLIYFVYKKRERFYIPTTLLLFLGLFVVSIAALSALSAISTFSILEYKWFDVFLGFISQWGIKIAPFILVGFLLSRKQGVLSILLPTSLEPFWIWIYLLPGGILQETWNTALLNMKFLPYLFFVLPILSFFILIPFLVLKYDQPIVQKRWGIIVSTIVISITVFIRLTILHEHGTIYILPIWAMQVFYTLILLSPIVFGVLLYPTYPIDREND